MIKLSFFMVMTPPTATAQEKQVKIINGRPLFYEPKAVKKAKRIIKDGLMEHIPADPITGPVKLTTLWCFPKGKSHKDKEWRVTRPDTDNLQKMLKDCMTQMHFWEDDAQVVHEEVGKVWADYPTGILIRIEELGRFMDE
jgi:Holliday junction resolvase RusA-like endonuclease